MNADDWLTPPERPQIQLGEVHLWRAGLDTSSDADWDLLSVEEQQRASRLRFDLHRARFVRAHAITRLILASYIGIPAHQLHIEVDCFGKPFLAGPTPFDVRFNLSHSSELMLLGITNGLEIGVDLEFHAENLDWHQIVGDYFSQREVAFLKGMETPEVARIAFYRMWTLKEAYLKAVGQGLRAGLDQVEVACEMGTEASFLSLPGGEDEKHRWQAFAFQLASGASGAMVVAKPQTGVRWLAFTCSF